MVKRISKPRPGGRSSASTTLSTALPMKDPSDRAEPDQSKSYFVTPPVPNDEPPPQNGGSQSHGDPQVEASTSGSADLQHCMCATMSLATAALSALIFCFGFTYLDILVCDVCRQYECPSFIV